MVNQTSSSPVQEASSIIQDGSRSISLQKVLDEDYYSGSDDKIITPPKAAALTERHFPRSVALSEHEESAVPRQTKSHKRTLTALLPFQRLRQEMQKTAQQAPERSPTKEKPDSGFIPTLTGDKDGQIRVEERARSGLSGWFTGSSTPIPVGVQVPESQQVTVAPAPPPVALPERSPARLQRRATGQSLLESPIKTPSTTSRFSFFSAGRTSPQQFQIPSSMSDEFLTLEVDEALFPNGSPSDQDPYSPVAFKNLLSNAETVLGKLQEAYKLRTLTLHELVAEKSALSDELEEAETRTTHLKLQLENMAAKVLEQDATIASLVAELMAERQARAEEKDAREKSIELVKHHSKMAHPHSPTTESVVSEDLHSHRGWRHSSDFESDNESASADSVFSYGSVVSLSEDSPAEIGQAVFARMVAVNGADERRPKPTMQRSTFQRMMSMGSEHDCADDEADIGCSNCRGAEASVAWDTVSVLKAENKGLKVRVVELDRAVEGALDLVARVGG